MRIDSKKLLSRFVGREAASVCVTLQESLLLFDNCRDLDELLEESKKKLVEICTLHEQQKL